MAEGGLAPRLRSALASLQAQHPSLAPGRRALIGVSGGRDSVALLHALTAAGWKKLVVCHLNHGLRGKAAGQDAAFVRRLAQRLGLPCEVLRVDMQKAARQRKISVELAAREERGRFFQQMARKHRSRFIFLAHHADDQAETILGNLCRGSALRGLAGMEMSAVTEGGLNKLRPLLNVTRSDIDDYMIIHALPHREDASNAVASYRRNRLRHEVLPLLNKVFNRDVAAILVRTGALLLRDESYLQQLSLDYFNAENVLQNDGSMKVTANLKALHPALLSRVLYLWLQKMDQLHGIGSHELQEALQMLQPGGPARINLPGNRWLRRKAGRMFIEQGKV